MNSWVPQNKIIKFSTTVVLFSIVLYFVGLFVVIEEIKKIENFYFNVESEFSKEEKIWVIESITETNKETIETLKKFFVRKNDEIKFIEQIEKTAQTSAVKFEIYSIDIKPDQPDPLKEDVNVKIKIEGSWKNLLSFVSKLERMPFGVSIQSFDLNADTPGNWSGLVEFIVFREK